MTETTLSDAKRALLAQRLRRREESRTITARAPGTTPPLSHAQERLWFLEQYRPGTTTYTVPVAARLRGDLDATALRRALDEIVARHEALRMRFLTTEDGTPELVVDGPRPAELRVTEAADLEAAVELLDAELATPFDLEHGPLFRTVLVRLAPDDHVLLIAAHHTVIDGWSSDVIIRELLALHDGATPPPAPVGYGDYALWQRGREHRGEIDHWREKLAGLPAIELPTDRPRPAEQGYEGAALDFRLDADLTRRLTDLGKAAGATPYMTLLAAFQVLLARYSGQADFAVGSPVAGRGLPELDGVVGMFVNTLVLRADLADDPSFSTFLARTRETALDAFAHQELPFDQLVNELNVVRDVSRSPLVQVTFALQNFKAGEEDGRVSYVTLPARTTRFDLGLYLFENPDGLVGNFTYSTALFDPETVELLASRFEALLRSIVASPRTRVGELSLLSEDERDLVLGFGSSAAPAPAGHDLLHDLVTAQAALTPGATAVVCGDSLTYAELDDRSTRIAALLRNRYGVGPDTRVGVFLEQSTDLAAAVIGVLKAGGSYVPLDPKQPRDRLAHMLGDAGAVVVVTTSALRDLVPGPPAVCLDEEALRETAFEAPPVTADHLAYVIYTSGTTGRPKGVGVQHRQVLTYLAGVRERFEVEPAAVYTLLQSLSFDFGVTIFYLSLMTGGELHLVDPQSPVEELAGQLGRTDYLKMTPSHLASLLADPDIADPADLLPRKLLVLGGEASKWSWARELSAHTTVVNHYGPTEATVGISTHAVTGEAERSLNLPIGRPLPGARVYVLDEHLRLVPPGMTGEIYLGGDRLARGYLGQPGLTADRFLPDPYGEPGARMYRTGDLGRWLPSGDLCFLGRRDLQVKVRGYRVELSEIESVLTDQPGVAHAVVELRQDRLIGYLVGERTSVSELRAALGERLPEYMIPARFVWLDELPLKSHGKVDRARLPEPDEERPDQEAGFVPPQTPVEEAIAGVWAQVLGLVQVGVLDDFFDLGGHSLLAAQVVARLRKALPAGGRQVSILDLFKHRTVRELAQLVEAGDDGPRMLLHRLTPVRTATSTLVCVPYGGGSAAIYQPLADAMPAGWALHAVAVPGQEMGLIEETRPVAEVAQGCVEEILKGIRGPLALYGHCGLGVMLTVEIARRLEAAGRPVEAIYLGGIFPFARPASTLAWLSNLTDRLRSDQVWANALQAAGLDVEDLDRDQLKLMIDNRRQGTKEAERYFTRLFEEGVEPLRAPIISVAGERDPATEFYQERYREWHLLTDSTAVVVLDEAGHFFLKYRAEELSAIVTGTHRAIASGETAALGRTGRSTWWLEGISDQHAPERPGSGSGEVVSDGSSPGVGWEDIPAPRVAGHGASTPYGTRQEPKPSMKRFATVAAGQLISIIGSSLTEFAVPLWIYVTTGSLARFALFSVLALVPGMLVSPLAGALVDRYDRRRVMLAGDIGAFGTQLALGILLWTGNLQVWHIYPLLVLLSVALTFQRLAYNSAVPQLVPKRFLGHANGVVQMVTGTAQLVVPLVAVGLMAVIGLEGILVLDVVSYVFAIAVLLFVRFPKTMAWKRRESLVSEMVEGWRFSWGNRGFRGMLFFFAVLNIFLSPLFLLISPLVLGFATLQDVGRISFAGGLGVFLGGLTMTVWGGPRRQRLRGVMLSTVVLAVFCLITGLQQNLLVIAIGAFGMSFWLTMLNGVYATIIQVKVPQRFHGRVIALNTLIAWSTLPIGFGLVAPYGSAAFEPLLLPGGPLADTVGLVLGTGEGRGVGLMYVLFAIAIAVTALVAMRTRTLSRFDVDVPDALPDDLVGFQTLQRRHGQERHEPVAEVPALRT
ncbi:non-ribosomal peptide synthetase/MFS transporter [Streptosporangium roseum]|uniref:Non-ribosomal peptide synthetase modules and related protein-like protein n=1 Tax=Streptosporangium roseum (strain ATCC 12428 / DSM 43021 / JCM 3005 / KCTC 9067 / NCIMB 10171 / NRRL 2505 / NI 9100) TaxID=479432 RepID=D2AY20_STRRD|nr:non-ribosomal peptide synthetase/MFS transporter [Streptosporangium roseum]ACZ85191.1 Non-ribosomal peptide synthetase modules and related protein-like protein [Streptosporangium roseum DSM 43021]